MTSIHDLPTPALLLDLAVLERNVKTMADRARYLGVALRPHIKTHKCLDVARLQRTRGAQGITVSTLAEARAFADGGFDDLTWAFPIPLSRVAEAGALADRITLRVVVDSEEAIAALEASGRPWHVWLKVDCGYHRAGVDPSSAHAVRLASAIAESATLAFDGILSHSGHAYDGPGRADVMAAAVEERETMVAFADALRARGVDVPAVSVGSTPAMAAVDHLTGVTEARPGNYVFHDYTQVLLGTCDVPDCALTVWTSVISCQPAAGHAVTDAGALALSKDAGRADAPHATLGEVFAEYAAGRLEREVRLTGLSQEHGKLSAPVPVGTRLRVLPNHSCLTAACFDEYHVVRGETVVDRWRVRRER